MWIVILLLITGIIILFFCYKEKNKNIGYALDDNRYRQYIYHSVQNDFKPYLQQILDAIDKIKLLEEQNSAGFNQSTYDAMIEVYDKANEIEEKIKRIWNSSRFNKDFSFYIGLHYTSHLLGNVIKQEQQIIKRSFVECKKQQKKWGNQIDNLKVRQQHVNGKQKLEISQEIGECCKAHKRISILVSNIGATNTLYHQRVSKQFMETAKRRDFIAAHFGERGRKWKERMHKRALIRSDRNGV